MEIIATTNAPQAIGPYSQAIVSGNLIFTSGQIALQSDGSFLEGDVTVQTRQVLRNLSAVLEAGGSKLSNVIKTTIFLADMEDFQKVNSVYGEFFNEHKPARSTVAVKALPRNALVEIEAIALR
ncbi:MAG: RidA family protein [Sulfurospirillum sp.]|jgi:2-iminobutanoate/2-iminopropanoate deaminase|nr:RidA family protein [Sulfurospirillum sp.]MBP9612308.1 RidA family protein [Sulfurospirillum sp.]